MNMKRIILAAVAVIMAVNLVAQSRIVEASVKSGILGAEKQYSVYLPDGYDSSGKDYPVLYLLHGASGWHRNWIDSGNVQTIADETIASGFALPVIIVMPDASGEGENRRGQHMGYFDMPGWEYEKFFFGEFVPAVESAFRIKGDKKHRAISGLSMGGGGTAVYAQHRPDMFSSACPLSGLLGAPSDNVRSKYHHTFIESAERTIPVGFLEKASPETAGALRTVRWYVDCGDDDYLLQGNIEFFMLMKKLGIPLEFRIRNGAHNWAYWRSALPQVLTFISTGFSE